MNYCHLSGTLMEKRKWDCEINIRKIKKKEKNSISSGIYVSIGSGAQLL